MLVFAMIINCRTYFEFFNPNCLFSTFQFWCKLFRIAQHVFLMLSVRFKLDIVFSGVSYQVIGKNILDGFD